MKCYECRKSACSEMSGKYYCRKHYQNRIDAFVKRWNDYEKHSDDWYLIPVKKFGRAIDEFCYGAMSALKS